MKHYTPEDVRRLCGEDGPLEHEYTDVDVADLINAAVKEAVEAEHRRLLEICKIGKEENPPDDDWARGFSCGTTRIEEAIRARGVKE